MIEYIGIAAVLALVLVGGLAIAFDKGLIWLTPERIAKIHEKGDALQARLEAKLAKKAKVVSAPAPVAAPAPAAPTNATKLAELNGMLISGKITLEQHALMAKLLA